MGILAPLEAASTFTTVITNDSITTRGELRRAECLATLKTCVGILRGVEQVRSVFIESYPKAAGSLRPLRRANTYRGCPAVNPVQPSDGKVPGAYPCRRKQPRRPKYFTGGGLTPRTQTAAVRSILEEAMDEMREKATDKAETVEHLESYRDLDRATWCGEVNHVQGLPTYTFGTAASEAAKSVRRPKSYLFTVKQGREETLKDYITRFNKETLCIDGCSDDLMLSVMMASLKPSKLLWSLGKNDPKDFQELMCRAQKYVNL
ncbi:hypothetical protein FNV43_RR17196 [Rhamnella rubrinervis]|uniref:Retrotransposon gag domain-containing protein n=1 Tax=Rhamnella rubrinervis TaxID=2594499 RepID=A0A8K0DYB9_9ROSA|nr:hypothetical protein FNV43_RR17196 [Rhamnella rubrinervis]